MELYEVTFKIDGDDNFTIKEVYAIDRNDAKKKIRDKYPQGKYFDVW